MEFANQCDRAIELHLALLQDKDPDTPTLGSTKVNFWRDTSSTTSTTKDFVDDSGTTLGYQPAYKWSKINPDNKNILFHTKYILGSTKEVLDGAGSNWYVAPNVSHWYKRTERYIKLNKRFVFDGMDDVNPKNCPYLVWWWTAIHDTDYSVLSAAGQTVKVNAHASVYFKSVS